MMSDKAFCSSRFMTKPGHDNEILKSAEEVYNSEDQPPIFGTFGRKDLLSNKPQTLSQSNYFLKSLLEFGKVRHPSLFIDDKHNPDLIKSVEYSILFSKTTVASDIINEPCKIHNSYNLYDLLRKVPRIFTTSVICSKNPQFPKRELLLIQELAQMAQLPTSIVISIRNTFESYYSFLMDPMLFGQYIDLFFAINQIAIQIFNLAYNKVNPDISNNNIEVHILDQQLKYFNQKFNAVSRTNHWSSENNESMLEYKAHTVTPLNAIQCIIDCFTICHLPYSSVTGFPLVFYHIESKCHNFESIRCKPW